MPEPRVAMQNETSFLVIVDDPQAVLVDPTRNMVSPVMHWAALTKFGIWDAVTNQAGAKKALRMAKEAGFS